MSWWDRFVGVGRSHQVAALERVARHRVWTLPPRTPWTADELGLSEAALLALANHRSEELPIAEVRALLEDIRFLGRERYEPAVPALVGLWERSPSGLIAVEAGRALSSFGSALTHDAVQARLGDPDGMIGHVAVWSLLVDARTNDQRFTELGERAVAGDLRAQRILRGVFFRLADELRRPPRLRAVAVCDLLAREPSLERLLVEIAARLRRGACDEAACAFLDACSADGVREAIARHPLRPLAPATELSLLDSYRSAAGGDAVWERLVELGPVDGALRARALEHAMRTMAPVARNADRITARLGALGWPLRTDARGAATTPRPRRPNPFTGEQPSRLADDERTRGDLDAQLRLSEGVAGARVPVAVEAFWRVVGCIDWSPRLDEPLPDWAHEVGIDCVDPLCVLDLECMWAGLDEWMERRDEGTHPELAGTPRIWIGPDRFHKMGTSGGAPYEVEFDGTSDPLVLRAPESLRFVPYLRHAFRWGGLPGMASVSHRSPELERVRTTLTAELEPF